MSKRLRFCDKRTEADILKVANLRGFYLIGEPEDWRGFHYCRLCRDLAKVTKFVWDGNSYVATRVQARGMDELKRWVAEHECPVLRLGEIPATMLGKDFSPENMLVVSDLLEEWGQPVQAVLVRHMARAESESLRGLKNRKQWLQRFPLGGRAPSEAVVHL
jgi:hypothetical protein